jgi:hypothetical protein
MRLENPKQHWKKGTKENIWTTYYKCRAIFTEIGKIGHGAFFQQCPESNIIIIDTFNGAKRIEFHKGGSIKPRVVKKL